MFCYAVSNVKHSIFILVTALLAEPNRLAGGRGRATDRITPFKFQHANKLVGKNKSPILFKQVPWERGRRWDLRVKHPLNPQFCTEEETSWSFKRHRSSLTKIVDIRFAPSQQGENNSLQCHLKIKVG